MHILRRRWTMAASVAAFLYLVSVPAMAAGLDGSSNLICSTMKVVACAEGRGCTQGEARDFELPEFMVLDVEQKVVRGTNISGIEEVSPVKNMETSGSQFIIQGVEEGHGWTLSIDSESGNMTGSVTGEMVSFLVLGACVPI